MKIIMAMVIVAVLCIPVYAEEFSAPFNERIEITTGDNEVVDIERVWFDIKIDITRTRSVSLNHLRILLESAKITQDNANKQVEYLDRMLKEAEKQAGKLKLKGKGDVAS